MTLSAYRGVNHSLCKINFAIIKSGRSIYFMMDLARLVHSRIGFYPNYFEIYLKLICLSLRSIRFKVNGNLYSHFWCYFITLLNTTREIVIESVKCD